MVTHYKQLFVYRQAVTGAKGIFQVSRAWPEHERRSLTDQARRSSRSVCANLAEAWAKRMYVRHFVAKITDAYGEAEETTVWLDFSQELGYITAADYDSLSHIYRLVCAGLLRMARQPEVWIVHPSRHDDGPLQIPVILRDPHSDVQGPR